MMNPEVKVKWLSALRSGQYKKGIGTLKDSTGHYCCLGVLCEVMNEEISDFLECYPKITFTVSVGLNQPQAHELAVKNDNGISFNDIADYIEQNL